MVSTESEPTDRALRGAGMDVRDRGEGDGVRAALLAPGAQEVRCPNEASAVGQVWGDALAILLKTA